MASAKGFMSFFIHMFHVCLTWLGYITCCKGNHIRTSMQSLNKSVLIPWILSQNAGQIQDQILVSIHLLPNSIGDTNKISIAESAFLICWISFRFLFRCDLHLHGYMFCSHWFQALKQYGQVVRVSPKSIGSTFAPFLPSLVASSNTLWFFPHNPSSIIRYPLS